MQAGRRAGRATRVLSLSVSSFRYRRAHLARPGPTHAARAARAVSTRGVRRALGSALALALLLAPRASAQWQRPLPDTTRGVHVFNDGLSTGLNDALVRFSAEHYAGTQKMTRSDADLLRAKNPGFVILHYRLGTGLGRKTISGPCDPNGSWYQVINGTWEQEWPGDSLVQEPWFAHWNGQRLVQCDWGWNLMDVANASYRDWWSGKVIQQLENNDDDGVFADSFVIPNYMGTWNPGLPAIDLAFEAQWKAKLEGQMDYLRQRFAGRWYLIPNVGWWVTSRDQTDYSKADGVFIEGFGYDVWQAFGQEGWQIQVDRLLPLIQANRAVIGQSYDIWDARGRMFGLATYLLIKGQQTFVNFEQGPSPEWFPEYEIPIGEPLSAVPASSASLYDSAQGVYRRDYSNGRTIVNPGNVTRTVALGGTWYRAQPSGGGAMPSTGVVPSTWRVDYVPVSSVTLQPGEGAVVLATPNPYELASVPLVAGAPSAIGISGATPAKAQYFFLSRVGAGSTPFPALGVTLGLAAPRLGAIRVADGAGEATWSPMLPATLIGATLHFQVAEQGRTSNLLSKPVY
jgi:hypothetical protein